MFDERRYFEVDPDGGACVFDVAGVPVGLVICEDLWFAEPLAKTRDAGAKLVVVPNASPFERDKHAQRDALLAQRVTETGRGAGLPQCRRRAGRAGVRRCLGRWPTAMAWCIRLRARSRTTGWLPTTTHPTRKFTPVHWPQDGDEGRDALAWRAVVRGTRDYCVKNGFQKVWLGLSGGIDSALVLAIAVDALGADNVTAVRLPSRYTAGLSNDLAAEQCATLGVRMESIAIEAPFNGFMEALAPVFAGRDAGYGRGKPAVAQPRRDHDGAVQQARRAAAHHRQQERVRGGLRHHLRRHVRRLRADQGPVQDRGVRAGALAQHRRRHAGDPAKPSSTARPPPNCAKTRPTRIRCRPYDVLDAILLRYVDQEQSRDEIVAAGFEAEVVDRMLRLVRINEWKRHQAAPGPKVSRRAFGRERRYPISNKYSG